MVKQKNGFTLIEVMIAIAIISVALVSIMGIQTSLFYTQERGTKTFEYIWAAHNFLVENQLKDCSHETDKIKNKNNKQIIIKNINPAHKIELVYEQVSINAQKDKKSEVFEFDQNNYTQNTLLKERVTVAKKRDAQDNKYVKQKPEELVCFVYCSPEKEEPEKNKPEKNKQEAVKQKLEKQFEEPKAKPRA